METVASKIKAEEEKHLVQLALKIYYRIVRNHCERMRKENKTIWTIGHSTHSFEEFGLMLHSFNIKLVADIRSYPGSRKFPQFNKEALEISLPQTDIQYVHLKDLGGRAH